MLIWQKRTLSPSGTQALHTGGARRRFAAHTAPVDTVDFVLFAASCCVCALFFFQGGAAGLLAATGAFAIIALRPGQPVARWRNAFQAAFAALWAGMMVGGMLAFAL